MHGIGRHTDTRLAHGRHAGCHELVGYLSTRIQWYSGTWYRVFIIYLVVKHTGETGGALDLDPRQQLLLLPQGLHRERSSFVKLTIWLWLLADVFTEPFVFAAYKVEASPPYLLYLT